MAESRTPGPLNAPTGSVPVPARTPGTWGINDHGDPNLTTLLGNTPGSLGIGDHADPNLAGLPSGTPNAEVQKVTEQGKPIAKGDKGRDGPKAHLSIGGVIVAGGALSEATIIAVNAAAQNTPPQFRRYIAYETAVKVGGSIAWRANNPGNLRDASTKIGTVSGAVGKFAVFATMDDGRTAQKNLYVNRYGTMKVRDAINKLTPPTENDTAKYLADLERAGVDLDKDVASQIDLLMTAVEANEGMITGTVVPRAP